MKKNQLKKSALTATIFITMLISCKKEQGLLPVDPADPQSTERSRGGEKLSDAELREEENLTRSVTNSTIMPATSVEDLRIFKKSPIPFKSFEMVDQNGHAISPDTVLTLKTGTKITARAYFARLNSMEQALNKDGYTLRNEQPVIASETVTNSEYLDGMIAKQPRSIGDLRTEQELDKFMTPVKQVDNLLLKPMNDYSPQEKKALEGYVFRSSGDNITASRSTIASAASPNLGVAIVTPALLKNYKTISAKQWSFGSASTFLAAIKGELIREATIYQFDPLNPNRSLSEFKVTGNGKIDVGVRNYNFNVLTAQAAFYAPASVEKNSTAKVTISIAGINVLNVSRSFAQRTVLSDTKTYAYNKSANVQIPIFWGLTFTGKLGIKGNIGLKYSATLDRAYVSAQANVFSSLTGYAEAGISFLGIVGGGVGSNLNVLSGSVDLRGSIYLIYQNGNQIVFGGSYYIGYNLVVLKGRVYCYVEACVPFVGCWRPVEHTFFSWTGWSSSGTILQGSATEVVSNYTTVIQPINH